MSPISTKNPGDDAPSGEFFTPKVWSCPLHDDPQTHACDCDECEIPYYTCEGCAEADWVDGPLTELTVGEARNRKYMQAMIVDLGHHGALLKMLKENAPVVSWLEDEAMPRLK